LTVMASPELIVMGERLPALGQTWLVAIIPTKYTNHVLLPRLKILSPLMLIQNLQLSLINAELAMKRDPRESFTILV
jgi:hypothetical protein